MANKNKRISRVPENETRQDRYRRVLNARLRPLAKRFVQISSMPIQPSYAMSESDIKHVMSEIKTLYDAFVNVHEKALAGTLKAKDIKEYTGVDWDKELEETEG